MAYINREFHADAEQPVDINVELYGYSGGYTSYYGQGTQTNPRGASLAHYQFGYTKLSLGGFTTDLVYDCPPFLPPSNPRIQLKYNGSLVKEYPGTGCHITFRFIPDGMKELVDFNFKTDSEGAYVFRGLEANLPETEMSITYTGGNNVCLIDGEPYVAQFPMPHSPSVPNSGKLECILTGPLPLAAAKYPGEIYFSDVGGSISWTTTGDDAKWETYECKGYTASGSYMESRCNANAFSIKSSPYTLTSATPATTYEMVFMTPADISAGRPVNARHYKYHLTNPHGSIPSNAHFKDINDFEWYGEESEVNKYQGTFSISTGFNPLTEGTYTYNPPKTSPNGWAVNDPPPPTYGRITLVNAAALGFQNTRAELVPDLTASGSANISLTGTTIIPTDALGSNGKGGWSGCNCEVHTNAGGGLNVTSIQEGAYIYRSDFTREKYSGETVSTSENLLPHLPLQFANIGVFMAGSSGVTDSLTMKIKGKSKEWSYPAKTDNPTRKDWTFIKNENYYSINKVENYNDAAGGIYIDEYENQAAIYGPTQFREIRISGFKPENEYAINGIYFNKAAGYSDFANINISDEWQMPLDCGSHGEGEAQHVISRNRYVTVIYGSRYAEIPNNQLTTTDIGIKAWSFPTLVSLKTNAANKGNRLLFPRDDYGAIEVNAPEPGLPGQNGNRPIADIFTTNAYIGWLYPGTHSEGAISIKPRCDTMDLTYYYNKTWSLTEGIIELRPEKGKIWRNAQGKILRNQVGKILRGDGY